MKLKLQLDLITPILCQFICLRELMMDPGKTRATCEALESNLNKTKGRAGSKGNMFSSGAGKRRPGLLTDGRPITLRKTETGGDRLHTRTDRGITRPTPPRYVAVVTYEPRIAPVRLLRAFGPSAHTSCAPAYIVVAGCEPHSCVAYAPSDANLAGRWTHRPVSVTPCESVT